MERPALTRAVVYVLKCILLALCMWVFLSFSLFNTSDKLDKYMQDLFNTRLGAIVYPDESIDSVAVLLLTDQVVDGALKGQWPAPYSFHAAVLDDLLQHSPKAVFIDFYWMNQLKPGGDYLLNVLKKYDIADIPVYLAAPSDGWFNAFWGELDGLVIPVSASVALDPTDFVSRKYPQANNELSSAAFAVVDAIYPEQVTGPRGEMDIFWGTAKNQKNWDWMDPSSDEEDGWVATFTGGFSSVGTVIPYTTTVFVRDLINPVGETEEAAQADLSDHLQNRIVIYGANVSGIQDYVFLPTRNVLPGAYYHAMAIDNLLTWRQGYKSDTPNLRNIPISHLPLWLFQLLALLTLSAAFLWRSSQPPSPHPQKNTTTSQPLFRLYGMLVHWMLRSKFWLALVIYVFLLCWFQFSVLDLSVATWVGFIELLGAGALIEKMDLVDRVISIPSGIRSFYQEVFKGEKNEQKISDCDVDDAGDATGLVKCSGNKCNN